MSTQVRARLTRVDPWSSRTIGGPLGLSAAELISAAAALVFLAAVVIYYFNALQPDQQQLRVLQEELARQRDAILGVNAPTAPGTVSPAEQAKLALASLDEFKSAYLKPLSAGYKGLFDEINALVKKNALQLTSGIDVELNRGAKDEEQAADAKGRKTSKSQKTEEFNVYPSSSVQFTVFGDYDKIRSFLNELEHDKQFVIIRSINLVNQEIKREGRSRRGPSVAGITLTIEMSCYFQPE